MKNPFKKITEEEKKTRDDKIQLYKSDIVATITQAQICLSTPEFKHYKEKYKATQEKVIEKLIAYNNPNPVEYAFAVREMVTNLRAIRTLIAEVEKDARRKL